MNRCRNSTFSLVRFAVFLTQCSALLLTLFLTGCVTPKQLAYFQGDSIRVDSSVVKPFITSIQIGDLLSVQVNSLNPEATAFFNPYTQISAVERSGYSTQTTPSAVNTGYLVGDRGTITLPLAGTVSVVGKTNAQAADSIQAKLRAFLKEPTVSVRNLNFRITVLGEVTKPSLFNVTNEQITLPEALGLAGDLTIYGRRDNILVIRQEGGRRTYTRLDLTRRGVLQSPHYYLHPNDVVYVEPSKSRVSSTDRVYQLVPIALSALSFVAIIVTRR